MSRVRFPSPAPIKSKTYGNFSNLHLPRNGFGKTMGRRTRLPAISMPRALAERTGGLANGAAGLFPSPALGERRHRSVARRRVAVSRRAAFVVLEGWSPHPRGAYGCGDFGKLGAVTFLQSLCHS